MNESKNVNIQLIDRPVPPVRLQFDEEEVQSLTEAIREQGILVPLLVVPRGDRYEVIDGDCRLEAANRLRLREVPCVVRDTSDGEVHTLRLLANLARSNPDPVSEAVYIASAIKSGATTRENLASKLHHGVGWIDDRLAIAEMPEYLQDAIREKKISLGVALELIYIQDPKVLADFVEAALRDGMNIETAKHAVYEYERFLRKVAPNEEGTPPPEYVFTSPIIKWPCAACGEDTETQNLKVVRVHKDGCPPV